ncbi:MAG: molybdenum cofactor biosysynthesis protein [Verrucomicrobia bacterium]|nr:molybdenum cofactor biosysynthesis protein [Verrucomicrobiota bacterium]
MLLAPPLRILHLFLSPAHNFFGHQGRAPSEHPTVAVPELTCLAGRGIEGDRFLDYKDDYKGQITFFDHAVYERLCAQLGIHDKKPSVFRRNVISSGVDLNTLIGKEFEVQGVRFRGREECRPCHWMDTAFGPGAEHALRGWGGLRATILNDGVLKVDREETAATADLAVAVGVSL